MACDKELKYCEDIQGKVSESHCISMKILIDDIDNRGYQSNINRTQDIRDLEPCRKCTKFVVLEQPKVCTVEGCNRANKRNGKCGVHHAKGFYSKVRFWGQFNKTKEGRGIPHDSSRQIGGQFVFRENVSDGDKEKNEVNDYASEKGYI